MSHENSGKRPQDVVQDQLGGDGAKQPGEIIPPASGGPPIPQHEEVAEQTRLEQKAQETRRDREERLIDVGRAQQTHG